MAALVSADQEIKWRAVEAMGEAVARLAAADPETAADVMRRFIWNLNEESGASAWGFPEAMAESMARDRYLAREFGHILASFINPEGLYLDNPILQKGVIWGMGRLAAIDRGPVLEAAPLVAGFLHSDDPELRGLAAWALGLVDPGSFKKDLEGLREDDGPVEIFRAGVIEKSTVGSLAREALEAVD